MAFNLEFARRPDSDYTVVAVAGLVLSAQALDSYVMVQNARGWDLPGGHLETGETPIDAFKRELMEESGYVVTEVPERLALLEITASPSLAVCIYTAVAKQAGERTATQEITAVKLGSRDEFVADYFGDKAKLVALLDMAEAAHKASN